MRQAVPSQHPAVVLRSHFNQLRALLAVALIALIGLTVALVIVAGNEDQASHTSTVAPGGRLNYEQQLRMFGFTPRQAARDALPGTRYDGGPEEGTRGAGH
jgi:hypothetical protein